MKILQVVTYISPDGAYGGPVRVAINQAKALTELGHEVVVAAAAGGFDGGLPKYFDSYPVHLFHGRRIIPGTGFAGMFSPRLLTWLAQIVRSADVVHIHLARDLITLPSAVVTLLAGKPVIVQTHGMIDHSDRRLANFLDQLLTRRVLKKARNVLNLTNREKRDILEVAGHDLQLVEIPNGVDVSQIVAVEQSKGPVSAPEILYLARLHSRKRPMDVVLAAEATKEDYPEARFCLAGPDEGEGERISTAIESKQLMGRVTWIGAIAPTNTLARMRQASIFVLPSTDEPFPMSVLEAMSVGLPVIVTDTCGLASVIKQECAGIVCDGRTESFRHAVELLLNDPKLRMRMGQNGRRAVRSKFSMEHVASRLQHVYMEASE